MHLEHIDHRDQQTQTNRRLTRRSFAFGALLSSAAILSGCAEGTRTDAERGRMEDAERTSVVRDLQATETWNLVNGTPGSTPAPEE